MTNIFFKHSDLFFSGKFIFRKNQKIWLHFKNKFQLKRKIGLEYLLTELINESISNEAVYSTAPATPGRDVLPHETKLREHSYCSPFVNEAKAIGAKLFRLSTGVV